jgi:arylformamidase
VLYRNFATQEGLDAQYNLRASVSDFAGYMEWYVTQCQKAREQLDCQLNVRYGPTLAERLNIFPATRPDAPILVYIHGGYWHSFSSKEFSFVAAGPVSAGVTTVVVNYALCPRVTIDEIVRQNRAAVSWVYRNAHRSFGDPARIHVAGHSADGHLVAMLLITDWEGEYGLPEDVIKGGCAISGLFDLTPFPYTYLQPKLQLTWDQILRNSPILHIPDSAPPLIITYGSKEPPEMQRQSNDFLRAWRERGLKRDFLPQPGKNHFSAIDGFIDADSPLCSAILRQLER